MIPRISSLAPLPDYRLSVDFDDGRKVVYDVGEDMALPGYEQLRIVPGLFQSVQLDQSRTCVYWNDEIDLPSDIIYEYGSPMRGKQNLLAWDPDFTRLTPAEAAALREAEAQIERGETVSDDEIDWDTD